MLCVLSVRDSQNPRKMHVSINNRPGADRLFREYVSRTFQPYMKEYRSRELYLVDDSNKYDTWWFNAMITNMTTVYHAAPVLRAPSAQGSMFPIPTPILLKDVISDCYGANPSVEMPASLYNAGAWKLGQ